MRVLVPLLTWGTLIVIFVNEYIAEAVILSGSSDSFARYPKWAQTFENELSFELKTSDENSLVLYTDDGTVNYNFFCISIVRGRLQIEFRLGDKFQDDTEKRPLNKMLVSDLRVDDNRWHKFLFFQAWENVKVQLDEIVIFKSLNQSSFVFGNLRTNSDIFVGGIPKEYTDLHKLSSPLQAYAKRFAGTIKSLTYRLYPQGMSSAQIIDSQGTRVIDDDFCSFSANGARKPKTADFSSLSMNGFCKNGHCYSTNTGPRCNCALTEYRGTQCEIKKSPSEVSLFGNEWLGYDLTDNNNKLTSNNSESNEKFDNFPSILSQREILNISFRTADLSALIAVAGDKQNYVQLMLENGILISVTQLNGSDKRIIRIFNKSTKRARFNDNVWHHVVLIRELNQHASKHFLFTMRMHVDGVYVDDVKQLLEKESFVWLGNNFLYVGGAPVDRSNALPFFPHNFRGCIRNIYFQADTIQLDLIELADQGFGKSHVRTFGDLSFSCALQEPPIFSFNTGQDHITLPAWNSSSSGNLGFQFRTVEPEGLILYHGVRDGLNHTTADYLAFELVDGHLFLVINLGSGPVRLQATASRVADGKWHSVFLERFGRTGSLTVDTITTHFTCPGLSANLIIKEKIYIGAAPWSSAPEDKNLPFIAEASGTSLIKARKVVRKGRRFRFPSTVWLANLRTGFIGCIKNLRINGINNQIATVLDEKVSWKGRNKRKPNQKAMPSLPSSPISKCPAVSSNPPNFCSINLCQHSGKCHGTHSSYRCDCLDTDFDGATCSRRFEAVNFPINKFQYPQNTQNDHHDHENANDFLDFETGSPSIVRLRESLRSESGNLEFKFQTLLGTVVLFDTNSVLRGLWDGGRSILVCLINGELALSIFLAGHKNFTFNWGKDLNDGQWHGVKVERRGTAFSLALDGRLESKRIPSMSEVGIYIDEFSIGRALRPVELGEGNSVFSTNYRSTEFVGNFRTLFFNGYDALVRLRRIARNTSHHQKLGSGDSSHQTGQL